MASMARINEMLRRRFGHNGSSKATLRSKVFKVKEVQRSDALLMVDTGQSSRSSI